MKLAVSGATGFVGSHVLETAVALGHDVIALTRRPQSPRDGVMWIEGDLHDRGALEKLVDDADAIIHVAGVIKGSADAFQKGNVEGTLGMLAAATAGGVRRFVDVSSLAAREPELSLYGASKRRAEDLVQRSGLDWAIVRPPAVYGPGDRETLELFKMAKLGVMLMPPKGRLSVLHADDLARLLIALSADDAPSNIVIEPDDGRRGGWTHREFASALAAAVGTKPAIFSSPGLLLRVFARADELVRGDRAKLTRDRAAYFSHNDWRVDPSCSAPLELWGPEIETLQGLKLTADWYSAQQWL